MTALLSRSSLHGLVFLSLLTGGGCKKAPPPTAKPPAAPVHVDALTVVAVDTPAKLRLTGSLRGARETELAANVSGRVLETFIERGASIQKGALLARVDVSAAALALAEAKLQVATSKTQEEINQADCARYEQLKARGAATDLEYDQVTAKCKTAPLNLETAKARQSIAAKNVGDGAIRAPFAGVIADRYVDVGEYVQSSSKVVSIAQIDELRLEFSVPEANWPSVKTGADVVFRVTAYGDALFHGKVAHIAGAVRDTRDVLVEATVLNTDRKLLPGMFASVDLSIGKRMLPALPKSAVFAQNGKQNVYVIKEGLIEQRTLQTSDEFEDQIPVLRGVEVGERVVREYKPELSNGQAVN
ncbi:MAG: efflux RND transporter periplasmic adaptor subunit [Polyangiaceae bacterium]